MNQDNVEQVVITLTVVSGYGESVRERALKLLLEDSTEGALFLTSKISVIDQIDMALLELIADRRDKSKPTYN